MANVVRKIGKISHKIGWYNISDNSSVNDSDRFVHALNTNSNKSVVLLKTKSSFLATHESQIAMTQSNEKMTTSTIGKKTTRKMKRPVNKKKKIKKVKKGVGRKMPKKRRAPKRIMSIDDVVAFYPQQDAKPNANSSIQTSNNRKKNPSSETVKISKNFENLTLAPTEEKEPETLKKETSMTTVPTSAAMEKVRSSSTSTNLSTRKSLYSIQENRLFPPVQEASIKAKTARAKSKQIEKAEVDHGLPVALRIKISKETRLSSKETFKVTEVKPSQVCDEESVWLVASSYLKSKHEHKGLLSVAETKSSSNSSSSTLSFEEEHLYVEKSITGNGRLRKTVRKKAEVKPKKTPKPIVRKSHVPVTKKLHSAILDDAELIWRVEAMKELLSSKKYREMLDDISIKVGKCWFHCNRLCLVICSRFFREQMRSGNLESNTTLEFDVDLPQKRLDEILEWMHTGNIDLHAGNIGDTLYLCDVFGIDSLAEKCNEMITVLHKYEGDPITLYEYAAKKHLKKVADEAAEIASVNFRQLINSERFVEYTYNQICLLFSIENIVINSELEIFYAVWKWLTHSWDYRKRYKDQLIHCVDFDKMTPKEIKLLANMLVEEKWDEDNPLTWGADGYVTGGLIRGLLKCYLTRRQNHQARKIGKHEREVAAIKIQRHYRKYRERRIQRRQIQKRQIITKKLGCVISQCKNE